jgi:hypothetical protein
VIKTRRNEQSKSEEQLNKLGKDGFKFTIAMRCESPQSVMTAVRHGVGVGLLFYETIKSEIDRGEFSIVKLPGIELIGKITLSTRNKSRSPQWPSDF